MTFKNHYIQSGYSEKNAEEKTKRVMKHFWISHRFIGFVFGKYLDGAGKLVRALNKKGFCVEIHTSRSMSTQKNVVGLICRTFTIMQCWLNGVKQIAGRDNRLKEENDGIFLKMSF